MNTHLNQYRQQQGLSLVELMVALVLGMLLMTGVIQVFLSSKQTYAANEANARIQENGRFALDFISRSARLGGYVEPVDISDTKAKNPLPVVALLCVGDNTAGISSANKLKICTTNGTDSTSDLVSFIFQPPVIDGKRSDCLGNSDDVGDDDIIINIFSIINPDANNLTSALGCHGYNLTKNDWIDDQTPQRLVEGIDRMQVLYGVTNTSGGNSVNQYISADRVTDWKNVLSLRISVLANSVAPTEATAAARQFVLLDAAPVTATDLGNDRRSRQIFTTTIQFKNNEL